MARSAMTTCTMSGGTAVAILSQTAGSETSSSTTARGRHGPALPHTGEPAPASTSSPRECRHLRGNLRAWRPHEYITFCDDDDLFWRQLRLLCRRQRTAACRKAWRTLREALAPYPGSLLDTLHDAGHNKNKQWHCFYTRCGCRSSTICCRSERNSYENDSCYRCSGLHWPPCRKKCAGPRLPRHCGGF